jgi:hypothetical protein
VVVVVVGYNSCCNGRNMKLVYGGTELSKICAVYTIVFPLRSMPVLIS